MVELCLHFTISGYCEWIVVWLLKEKVSLSLSHTHTHTHTHKVRLQSKFCWLMITTAV